MKFQENNAITIKKYGNVFVYFLLKNKDVVYVGQTRNGIARPLSHRDKDFDTIKIIYCPEKDLDIKEDEYIRKYKPMYNKQNNYAIRYGLLRVRDSVRNKTQATNITVPTLKKHLQKLHIKTEKDYFNGKETISFDDYITVIEYIKSIKVDIYGRELR